MRLCSDVPTASTLVCNATVVDVNTATVCSIVPLKAGVQIFARSSFFAPSQSTGGVVSGFGPVAANLLTFTYTAAATTSAANVTEGRFSSLAVVVVGE